MPFAGRGMLQVFVVPIRLTHAIENEIEVVVLIVECSLNAAQPLHE